MNDYSKIEGTGFSITTFWVDWFHAAILFLFILFLVRWAYKDKKQALIQGPYSWLYASPLFLAALGALAIAFGMLIREDFWEMRFIFSGLILWVCSGSLSSGILFYKAIKGKEEARSTDFIAGSGTFITSILLIIPLSLSNVQIAVIEYLSYIYYALLIIGVGFILTGVIKGLQYKFPLFFVFIGSFFLTGLGITEIIFKHCSFLWLIRIWNLRLTLEYIGLFPESYLWQINGWIKLVIGIGLFTALIIILLKQKHKRI